MKTLNDSAIFKQSADLNKIINTISSINYERDRVPIEELKAEFSTIQRRFHYGFESKIFNDIGNSKLILIDGDLNLPNYLSVVGVLRSKSDRKSIAMTINLHNYINSNKEISARTLYALMVNGEINLAFFENWDRFVNDVNFIKLNSFIYSRIVTRVFDKLFAIDLNKPATDFISFLFAKFFLVNMCGKSNNDYINNIALKTCFNKTSEKIILMQEQEMISNSKVDDLYLNIFNLFKGLNSLPTLNNANPRTFIENYLKMYGESTLLTLDYLPAYMSMIMSQVVNGNLNKEYAIEKVAGSQINKAYVNFLKLMD